MIFVLPGVCSGLHLPRRAAKSKSLWWHGDKIAGASAVKEN
jgi:hypothetical protein